MKQEAAGKGVAAVESGCEKMGVWFRLVPTEEGIRLRRESGLGMCVEEKLKMPS